MNTDYLKYLIAISKTKSMSHASESLFITPQALSVAIKKLEEELGMPLLIRSSTGTELTENGQWLVSLSTHFFNEIAFRQAQYQQYLYKVPTKPSGVLDLLLNSSGINESQLGELICEINLQEPDLQINLKEASRKEVENAVKDGSCELAFIYRTKYNKQYIDELEEPLVFYPLQKGILTILAHEKLPFAKFDSTFLKKITEYPICAYEPIDTDRSIVQLMHFVTNKSLQYTACNNYGLYRANLAQGNSIAVTVKFPGDERPFNYIDGCKCIGVRDDVQIYFGALRRKEELLSENATYFWHKLLSIYSLN